MEAWECSGSVTGQNYHPNCTGGVLHRKGCQPLGKVQEARWTLDICHTGGGWVFQSYNNKLAKLGDTKAAEKTANWTSLTKSTWQHCLQNLPVSGKTLGPVYNEFSKQSPPWIEEFHSQFWSGHLYKVWTKYANGKCTFKTYMRKTSDVAEVAFLAKKNWRKIWPKNGLKSRKFGLKMA